MKYIPPKYDRLEDMASIDVARLTEDEARAVLEGIRWPKGVICVHCGSKSVGRIKSTGEHTRDGLWKCYACRKQFTVTVGTIMEDSHITLRQWLQAFQSMSAHKKGVSAAQLQRDLGLGSYRSAWHLAHRIRKAMGQNDMKPKLKGTVEVDETYIGGKPTKSEPGVVGRGTKKTPVLVMVAREGQAVSRPVERVNAATLKGAILEAVDPASRIMTDEFSSYKGLGRIYKGGHRTVNHGRGQYAKGKNHEVNTNSAESYFAILKRGVHGTFHHISKKHLDRYCDEFAFRWSNRDKKDGERAVEAVKGMAGKRLKYITLVGRG